MSRYSLRTGLPDDGRQPDLQRPARRARQSRSAFRLPREQGHTLPRARNLPQPALPWWYHDSPSLPCVSFSTNPPPLPFFFSLTQPKPYLTLCTLPAAGTAKTSTHPITNRTCTTQSARPSPLQVPALPHTPSASPSSHSKPSGTQPNSTNGGRKTVPNLSYSPTAMEATAWVTGPTRTTCLAGRGMRCRGRWIVIACSRDVRMDGH